MAKDKLSYDDEMAWKEREKEIREESAYTRDTRRLSFGRFYSEGGNAYKNTTVEDDYSDKEMDSQSYDKFLKAQTKLKKLGTKCITSVSSKKSEEYQPHVCIPKNLQVFLKSEDYKKFKYLEYLIKYKCDDSLAEFIEYKYDILNKDPLKEFNDLKNKYNKELKEVKEIMEKIKKGQSPEEIMLQEKKRNDLLLEKMIESNNKEVEELGIDFLLEDESFIPASLLEEEEILSPSLSKITKSFDRD